MAEESAPTVTVAQRQLIRECFAAGSHLRHGTMVFLGKSDDLAKHEALDRWIDRNKAHGHRIGVEAALIGLRADEKASARVAAWAYEREKG